MSCNFARLNTMILFTKGTELTIFGQLKILMKFSIILNLKALRLLNCLHMNFLHCIHHLMKDKLIDLINRTLAAKNVLFSPLLMHTRITMYVLVKKSVIPLFIFWIAFY